MVDSKDSMLVVLRVEMMVDMMVEMMARRKVVSLDPTMVGKKEYTLAKKKVGCWAVLRDSLTVAVMVVMKELQMESAMALWTVETLAVQLI